MDADHTPVVALWLLSLALALVATAPWPWPTRAEWGALVRARALPRVDWLLLGGLLLGALALRVVALDRLPYVFGGDEGSQAMSALAVLEGRLKSPFGTGWATLPTLWVFLQAASIALFGDTVGGVRVVSGIVGALAVVFTYLYARRLFGRGVALVAAALLAAFHYHVLFSRLASVQITESLCVVALLWLLDRALYERRPLDALLAGMVLGLSQYLSFGNRLLPLIALAYVVYAALSADGRFRPRVPRLADWRPLARPVGWIALGAGLVFLPLFAHYLDFPGQFNWRVDGVSMFASGWLAREQQATGKGALELVLWQVSRAVGLPFNTPPGGWYVGMQPIVGLPMALPIAIGLAIATLGALRRRYFGLAMAYWVTVLGLGLTEDPTQTQRFVAGTSLLAVLAAIGICLPMQLATFVLGLPRLAMGAVVATIVAVLAAWNVHYTVTYAGLPDRYGTTNGLVATELAYYLRLLGPGHTVHFFAPPRMYYYGFNTLPFIARGTFGVDVERPLAPDAAPLPVPGPTVFAFLPERVGELAQVRAWYPNGELREFRDPSGAPLLATYRVERPWPAGQLGEMVGTPP